MRRGCKDSVSNDELTARGGTWVAGCRSRLGEWNSENNSLPTAGIRQRRKVFGRSCGDGAAICGDSVSEAKGVDRPSVRGILGGTERMFNPVQRVTGIPIVTIMS